MIRWRKMVMSQPGSEEWKVSVPNPVDSWNPQEIRISIFCIPENKPEERFRAHVYLDKREVFRLFDENMDEAKKRSVEGIRELLTSYLKELS